MSRISEILSKISLSDKANNVINLIKEVMKMSNMKLVLEDKGYLCYKHNELPMFFIGVQALDNKLQGEAFIQPALQDTDDKLLLKEMSIDDINNISDEDIYDFINNLSDIQIPEFGLAVYDYIDSGKEISTKLQKSIERFMSEGLGGDWNWKDFDGKVYKK